jgi:hypothetical protein
MRPIVILILIVAILATLSFFGKLPEEKREKPPTELQTQVEKKGEITPVTKKTTSQVISPSKKEVSSELVEKEISEVKSPWVETFIVSGPKEGEIINETNKVTFEFKAVIYPKETQGKAIFETKIEGIDQDWQKTSSQTRTITLPTGPKEYTFLVRAKIDEVTDPTPATRTFKINVSPHFQKITISNIQIQSSSRPSLITLSSHLNRGEEINITGWQISGKKGSFFIPKGIEKYSPYNSEPIDDIIVKPGDTIYLSGAANPLGRDRNFRPNKCLGYLTNYHDFPIPLSKDCPKPTEKEISHLSDCCQQFISKLGKCQAPDYSKNLSIMTDPDCTSYLIQNLNYLSCFNKYSQEEDFLKKEWHIYMGHNFLSQTFDTLYLRDEKGLVVDTYQYGCLICK